MSRELSENGKYELLKIVNYTKLLLLLLLLENHAKALKLRHMRYAIKSARPRYLCCLIIYLCIISCSCVIAIDVCLIGWHLSAQHSNTCENVQICAINLFKTKLVSVF